MRIESQAMQNTLTPETLPESENVTPLIHLAYASAAVPGFSKEQILEMLQRARKKNESLDITGMLLFSDKSFFQVLEGPKSQVETLFEKISRDTRHTHMLKVFEGTVAKECFKDWSMGLAFLDREHLEMTPGCNDFFRSGKCLHQLDSSTTKKLLEAFKDGCWRTAIN